MCNGFVLKCVELACGAVILEMSQCFAGPRQYCTWGNQEFFKVKASLPARKGDKLANHYFLYQPATHQVHTGRQFFLWDSRNSLVSAFGEHRPE